MHIDIVAAGVRMEDVTDVTNVRINVAVDGVIDYSVRRVVWDAMSNAGTSIIEDTMNDVFTIIEKDMVARTAAEAIWDITRDL